MDDLSLVVDKETALTELKDCLESGQRLNKENCHQIKAWKKKVTDSLDELFESDGVSSEFSKKLSLKEYGGNYLTGEVTSFSEKVPRALKYLKLLIKNLNDPPEAFEATADSTPVVSEFNDSIFVVHGHDESSRLKVEDVLKSLNLEPVIINSKANSGLTIIEKIEKFSDVGFAVVLFTPDDLGASIEDHESGKYEKRPRQNVVLELGYFWGQLGRERVCMLNSIGEDLSSDLRGLGYTTLDSSNAWKFELVKELKAAGYDVDANKLLP